MRKSAKIWLVIAILLCACVTVLNFTEGRIPSVILALVEIAALVVLLVKEKKAGFWLLCGCYLLSFLTGVTAASPAAPASCSRWVLRQSARY